MKIIDSLFTVLVAILLLLFHHSNLFAAKAYSDAYIDWSTVHISFTGNGEIVNDYYEANAKTHDHDLITDPVDASIVNINGAQAWGEADPEDYYQDLYAQAMAQDTRAFGRAYADAGYYGLFTTKEAGTLTISMDAHLWIETNLDDNGPARATARAIIDINGIAAHEGQSFFSDNSTGAYNTGGYTPYHIRLDYELGPGDQAEFGVYVTAEALANPVPVPCTGGLSLILCAGSLCLLGPASAGRKQQA